MLALSDCYTRVMQASYHNLNTNFILVFPLTYQSFSSFILLLIHYFYKIDMLCYGEAHLYKKRRFTPELKTPKSIREYPLWKAICLPKIC